MERTDEAVRLDLTVRLMNPNDQVLELRDIRYAFEVQGQVVYRGLRSAEAALSDYGSKAIVLPAISARAVGAIGAPLSWAP